MEEKRSASQMIVWLISFFVMTSLYSLSVGPAALIRDHGMMTQQTFLRLYAPIGWLYEVVPFFRDALEWYLKLWTQAPAG
jgi:hypothetical protein